MKLWPKDKNITCGQGHRAAWIVEERTGIQPLTPGHKSVWSDQLAGERRCESISVGSLGLWAWQEALKACLSLTCLRSNCVCHSSTDEMFGKSRL